MTLPRDAPPGRGGVARRSRACSGRGASNERMALRTWLTLWLCLCLLAPLPVRGDCCVRMAAAGMAGAAAPAEAASDVPPCHRQAEVAVPAQHDGAPSPASPDGAGCDHCQCPCRIAALPSASPPADRLAAAVFAAVAMSASTAERDRIPPLPPPIA